VAHLDIHLGGLSDGGSARHNARVGIAAPPLVLPDCMLPRSGIQGGTYPTKESAVTSIGQMQDLVSAALYLLSIGMVKVSIRVDDNGKWRQCTQVLKLTDVAKVSPALVYWTSKQIDDQYRSTG